MLDVIVPASLVVALIGVFVAAYLRSRAFVRGAAGAVPLAAGFPLDGAGPSGFGSSDAGGNFGGDGHCSPGDGGHCGGDGH